MIQKLLLSVTFFICLATFTSTAQPANSIRIESNSASVEPLKKMIGPFPKNDESYYNFDVDNNGIVDFRITTEGYDAGSKKDFTITFEAFDNSAFATETVMGHSLYTDSSGNPVDIKFPAPVVKMYNEHDMIYASECTESKRFLMSSYSSISYDGVHPSQQIINNWISGVHYIGIKKVIGNQAYLGWIKLEVVNQQEVYLDSYTRMYAIEPLTIAADDFIYPNPTLSVITIQLNGTNKVEFYNACGALVLTEENTSGGLPFTIDLSGLSSGVYIAKLISYTSDKVFIRKIVKQ